MGDDGVSWAKLSCPEGVQVEIGQPPGGNVSEGIPA